MKFRQITIMVSYVLLEIYKCIKSIAPKAKNNTLEILFKS